MQFTEVQTTIYRINRGRKQKRRVIYGMKLKRLTQCYAIQHMILSLQVAFFPFNLAQGGSNLLARSKVGQESYK